MSDILDLANNIATCKEDIRQAIINKKVNCDNTVPLNQYADKISQIRLASDYSDVVSVDAINYTGKDIKKGDKVWIVPNYNKNAVTVKKYSNDSNDKIAIITRDGKKIYTLFNIYDVDTNTLIKNYNEMFFRFCFIWGKDTIYNDNLSLINPRNFFTPLQIHKDFTLINNSDHKYTIKDKKLNKSITFTTDNNLNYTYTRYNSYNHILYSHLDYDNSDICYKVDWSNSTVTQVFKENNGYTHFASCTSDGKYVIINHIKNNSMNNYQSLLIRKIRNENDYLGYVVDWSDLNNDFINYIDNTTVYFNYNFIDEILYIIDFNQQIVASYKYNSYNGKFNLILKANLAENISRSSSYSTNISGSGDGKILINYNYIYRAQDTEKVYKAIQNPTIEDETLTGIAEENATTNQSFKVGVALGPLTQLTVTSSTENAEITVE